MEASQETIVDQHQTVEQFRGLVHRLKMDLAEKRSVENTVGRGEEKEVDGRDSKTDLVNINVQVKSAIKEQSRVSLLLCTNSCCGDQCSVSACFTRLSTLSCAN